MNRSRSLFEFVAAGVFAGALLAGCSEEVKPNNKPAANTGKPSPAAKGSQDVVIPTENATAVKTGDGKSGPAMDSVPEPSSEPKAAPKDAPKPAEGKVEVKAEPDPPSSEPKSEAKPQSKSDARPEPALETSTEVFLTAAPDSDESPTPKFSTFASAADLAAELKILVADLEKAAASEATYKDQVEGRFARDGNTIALIAIALGLHDEDSPVKPQAKAIAAAARKLAQANDFAATAQAVADLKTAVSGKAVDGDDLKWAKVAALSNLMNDQVPNINTKLKNGLRHFKNRAAEVSANAAAMALIAENARLYLSETKLPKEDKKWYAFAAQLRASAAELAAKAHAGDEAGAKAAMDRLDRSCHECHAVFNPEK